MSTMSTQAGRVEHYEFVAMLMAELPRELSAKPNWVAALANGLVMLSRRHSRLCEAICNGEAGPNHALPTIERKIVNSLENTGLEAIFSRDPRGATVKLKLPSGRSNSFGGEGYCVP